MSEIIELMASDIEVDEEWNCRDAVEPDTGGDDTPGLSLDELEVSIRRYGVLQSLVVQRLVYEPGERRRWRLVAGFRRHQVCSRIDTQFVVPCTVLRRTGDAGRDELLASIANLAENLQRRNLRAHEIANTLYRVANANPDLMQRELAELVGVNRDYCSKMLRVRRKAIPELWAVFVRHGTRFGNGITFGDFVEVVTLDKEKQLTAWRQLVEDRNAWKPFAREKVSKRLSRRQIKECLKHVPNVDGSEQYRRGIRQGLLIALGETTLHKHKDADSNGAAKRKVKS